MEFKVMVRGFTPRPWKSKSGEQRFSGKFVLLDMSEGTKVMDTMVMEQDLASEDALGKAALLVDKIAVCHVSGLRVGMDGKAQLQGTLTTAPAVK